MKKIICTIFVVFLLVAVISPPVVAADREDFSVTRLTVLGKIYGGGAIEGMSKALTASTDWTLSRIQSLCQYLKVTKSGSGVSIIVPTTYLRNYDMKIVRNESDSAVIIKKASGSGVSIASGKTAIVIYNGSDYVRVTADATN